VELEAGLTSTMLRTVVFQLTLRFLFIYPKLGILEVEDLDIGYGDDLAGDVDDGQDADEPNPDSEALDTSRTAASRRISRQAESYLDILTILSLG
jgi:hypothetical protein